MTSKPDKNMGINPDILALREDRDEKTPPPPEGKTFSNHQQPEAFRKPFRIGKDLIWLSIWISGIAAVGFWDVMFLNTPALKKIAAGLINTFFISLQVIIYTLILAWAVSSSIVYLENRKNHTGYLVLTFIMNLTRSIPQIVGILFGYIFITSMYRTGTLSSSLGVFFLMAVTISLFTFVEMVDLMRDRIHYFKTLDFYNAMRVCGFSEFRIINFHILWKNSRIHIFNKLIAIFGIAVFLQCHLTTRPTFAYIDAV